MYFAISVLVLIELIYLERTNVNSDNNLEECFKNAREANCTTGQMLQVEIQVKSADIKGTKKIIPVTENIISILWKQG